MLTQFLGPLLALTMNFCSETPALKNDLTPEQKTAIVNKHNYFRKEVGVGPLQWDNELEAFALEWANEIKKRCRLQHRPYSGKFKQQYGENIAMNYSNDATTAVDQWASEKQYFKARSMRTYKSEHLMKTGHYTQMIWRKTTKIGCARVKCSNGTYIVVCNYDPPGNIRGQDVY